MTRAAFDCDYEHKSWRAWYLPHLSEARDAQEKYIEELGIAEVRIVLEHGSNRSALKYATRSCSRSLDFGIVGETPAVLG